MDGKSRMLLAEYHVPAGAAMEPSEEVTRLYRLGYASMQVEPLPSGVQYVRWWYTGPYATGGNGSQAYIGEPATSAARGLPVSGGDEPEQAVSRPIITDPTGTPALGLTDDPLAALRECLAFSSRDWSQEADLAWLYGIVLGWDDPDEADADATEEIAARFGWDAAKVARLRVLRAAFTSRL